MAVAAGTFKKLANRFMSDTFAVFRKDLVMRTADAPVFGSPQTYTEEAGGYAIPLSLNFGMFESSMIEIGDFMLFTNASQWATDPEVDGVDLIYDGVQLSIIHVEKDADNAAYFMKVRRN